MQENVIAKNKLQELTDLLQLKTKEVEQHKRSLEITLALERVQKKIMNMQSSRELSEVTARFFFELNGLVTEIEKCDVIICNHTPLMEVWSTPLSSKDNLTKKAVNGKLDYRIHSVFQISYDAWKQSKKTFSYTMKGDEVRECYDKLQQASDHQFPNIGKYPNIQIVNCFNFKEGFLFILTKTALSNEVKDFLDRFAKIYSLAFKRYLDKKKVEEQALEAQIEAALERVRSRSNRMQKSEELANVIILLNDELHKLGVNQSNSVLMTDWDIDNIEAGAYLWLGVAGQKYLRKYHVPFNKDHQIDANYLEARKKNITFYTESYTKEEKDNYFRYHFKNGELNQIPNDRQKFMLDAKGYSRAVVSLKNSGLFVQRYSDEPFTKKQLKVIERFGNVFEQTYARFLDLQKAEEQAREAFKQAALDRVRGEIASMRTSDDLNRITPLIWRELQTLEVPFFRCGVFIFDEEKEIVQVFLTNPDGRALAVLNLSFDANELTKNTVEHWRKKRILKNHWNKQEFINWTKSMMELGQVDSVQTYQGSASAPESLNLHFVPFRQGMLYVGDVSPLPYEKIELVKKLAETFSIAYARYEDFKNLEEVKNKIEFTLSELKAAQAQLVQTEKMASLGELSAAIAHEIRNPLNFINNFSEINKELLQEMKEEIATGNLQPATKISDDIIQNLDKILNHGKRAESIVKGMLLHSRRSGEQKEPTDINALCDEFLRLSYHGFRAKDKSFNAEFKTEFDESLPKINVIPQDIGRVLLNLINNAFYAVQAPPPPEGGVKNAPNDYKPIVIVKTAFLKSPSGDLGVKGSAVEIRVQDNGPGIPSSIKDKIFQPFFTTKPTGQGTGLGLSISYDIVKAHGGELRVETTKGEGSEFIIQIPAKLT